MSILYTGGIFCVNSMYTIFTLFTPAPQKTYAVEKQKNANSQSYFYTYTVCTYYVHTVEKSPQKTFAGEKTA